MTIAAIDIGGTFTDCVVYDKGRLQSLKVPSTPPDLERGVIAALARAAQLEGRAFDAFMGELVLLLQGTTQAINTLLTRTGAKVGMITTKGFRDIIETRRGMRAGSPYNLFQPPYAPLVPRNLRLGVGERTRYTAEITEPLEREELLSALAALAREGVESIAVCFLYSYLNPANEKEAGAIIRERHPEWALSLSSEVLPVWREYERFSTTVVNAYVAPKLAKHLAQLENTLGENGFRGPVMLMTGGGLLESPAYCSHRAVHLLGSGPAGSANAALYVSRALDLPNIISVDMGGTSFDVCLVRAGQINTTSESWIEGHRVAVKSIAGESIGAGGGSIAWIDERGLLRVGPQSAGAVPGPACYAEGGSEPTVTDANLVMGAIAPESFRWQGHGLDADAAVAALERLGRPLRLTAAEAAVAVYETVNEVMAGGITGLTTKKGIDPRDFVLVAGGGAGAIHAAAIAEHVGLKEVIVPSFAGVYSAFGILSCDRGVETAQSHPAAEGELEVETANAIYAALEAEALAQLKAESKGKVVLLRSIEMRYSKQYHEVEVEVPGGVLSEGDLAAVVRRFHDTHRRLYSFSIDNEKTEFLTFRLRASIVSDLALPTETERVPAEPRPQSKRAFLIGGARRQVPVFAGQELAPGHRFEGPGLVEERTATIYVPPGFRCLLDRWRNYRIERI